MKIKILESGTEGREINPFGEEPHEFNLMGMPVHYLNHKAFLGAHEMWQQAEDSRKVYQIENGNDDLSGDPSKWLVRETKNKTYFRYEPGTIHEAVLLENGRIKITD